MRDAKESFGSTIARKTRETRNTADWWTQCGYSAPNMHKIAMRILAQTASSSACERNWSTFAIIHTKQRNRLAYQKLEKLVYCYYNMKLRLRDKQAKNNVVNENNYIDLLHVASEPLDNGIDPLHDWIMPAHLDDEAGRPLPQVVETATNAGINVERVLSEEVVKNPEDNSDSDDAWGGTATPDSSDDGGEGGSGTGGGGERYEYGQSSVDGGFQFTCEGNFDHATQDEDHEVRTAGHGAQEKTRYGRRTRGATDYQSTPSDVSSIALSFDSISLGTERSGISNESHEGNNQFSYDAYGYNQYGEVVTPRSQIRRDH
ncbi:hypothetical protein ABKV19_022864 [Rosa sericea]